MEPRFRPPQLEQYVKRHILWIGDHISLGVAGRIMASKNEYLLRAAELNALAQVEKDHADKLEYETLACAYLRLAKQAERNSQTDIVYETPPEKKRDRA